MPTADVEKVVASKIAGVRLGMEALATATDAAEIRQRVGKMVTEYGAWIDCQRQIDPGEANRHRRRRGLGADRQMAMALRSQFETLIGRGVLLRVPGL